jgi:hypothetical protein
MRGVEQLEADQVLPDADVEQCRAEGRRPDVQVEVVPGPGVDWITYTAGYARSGSPS